MGSRTVIFLWGLFLPWCLSRRYFYQTQLLSWGDAQQNCRQHYTDLATFESMEDISSLQRPPGVVGDAWIGLREDPQTWQHMGNASTSWRWSSTGQTSQSGFSNWVLPNPNNLLGEACVHLNAAGKWIDWGCELLFPSVCFSGTAGNISYVHNPILLSWSDAQKHCRENYVDLATIESADDNSAVVAVMPAITLAWIGLHRIPLAWSDQNPSTFRNWMLGQPDYFGNIENCGYETDLHTWADGDCDVKLLSICHTSAEEEQSNPGQNNPGQSNPETKETSSGEVKTTMKTTVKQTISSSIDLTDPAVLQQIQQQLRKIVGDVKLQLKTKRLEPEKDHQPQCPYKIC